MLLANKISQEAQLEQQKLQQEQNLPLLLEWLDGRFGIIMKNIPDSLHNRITRYVYSLDPSMVSSPNIDAKVKNLNRLRTYTPQIHQQLVMMMRDTSGTKSQQFASPHRTPNVLNQVYPNAKR